MGAYSESLAISAWGMVGIFVTMMVIGGVAIVLTRLFPGK